MKFGQYPAAECEGWILAHSVRIDDTLIEKGRTLSSDDIAALDAAGIETIMAAQLEAGDIGENIAAERIAKAIVGPGLSIQPTGRGRVNLRADRLSLFEIEGAHLDAINGTNEGVSVATLPPWSVVAAGQIVATVKIVPFALQDSVVRSIETIGENGGKLSAKHYQLHDAALIQTTLPGTSPKLFKKTHRAMTARLERLGSRISSDAVVPHDEDALAELISNRADSSHSPILVMGASATLDRRDVVPAALIKAGGTITRFGMPVDPGNLLVLGKCKGQVVIGLPGCARSMARNGFDWVLEMTLAGIELESDDIRNMGLGGLLKEPPDRLQPRNEKPTHATANVRLSVAAIVLAAGTSSRMGEDNKLLAPAPDKPLIGKVIDTLTATRIIEAIVVTGHEAEKVSAALEGRNLTIIENPDYIDGLGTSVACGIKALSGDIDAALIVLGDMPLVEPATIDALIEGLDLEAGISACAPSFEGKRGNPVLWSGVHFPDLAELTGDTGAKKLLGSLGNALAIIETNDPGVLFDVDTKDALAKLVE